jgi:hypothetical protein
MLYLRAGGRRLIMLLLVLLWVVRPAHAQSPSDTSFLSILGALREASFPDKEAIIDRLSQTGHPSVRVALTAFMEDRLFFRNDNQGIVVAKSIDGRSAELELIDPISLKPVGTAPVESLTAINTNNHIRSVLKTTIAHFALASPDAQVRLDAVRHDGIAR